jgi:ParB-like chromosome segregation protein Spo0J
MAKKDKTEPRGTVATVPVWCRFDEGVTLEKLVPHPRNYNKHPDTQIALLAKIIKAQGWRNPVVVSKRSGFVVKGHGRIEAARLMQVDAVPVEYQDYETEAAEYADMIADNRIAELAEPDNAMLKDLLQELDTGQMDMDLTGFDAGELERLMTQLHTPDFQPASKDEQGKLDELKPQIVSCPHCGKDFNIREQA